MTIGTAAHVAAWGVAPARPLANAPLPDIAWADLLGGVVSARIEGLLGGAVSDGALPVTDEQRVDVVDCTVAAAAGALRIERRLLDVTETLARAGIDYRVIKGPALAHTVYPDPAHRGFGDIDLVIPSDAWDTAVTVLEADGARRTLPELRPGFDRRFGKEATLVGDDLIEVDLHRTFVIGPLGLTVDLPALFRDTDWFELGGRKLPTLAPVHRFLAACFNAALADDPANLHALRDVVQILLVDAPDAGAVLAAAAAWRAQAVVARAVVLAWTTLGLDVDHELVDWATRHRPRRIEAGLVRTYQGGGRSYLSQGAAIWVIPGIRNKAAYVRAIAWPQPAYLASRGFTRTSHWQRARRFVFGERARRAG
jgi:hypothetical protein